MVGRLTAIIGMALWVLCGAAASPAMAQGALRSTLWSMRSDANAAADAATDPNAPVPADPNAAGDPNVPGPVVDVARFAEDLVDKLDVRQMWESNSVTQWLFLLGAILAGVVAGRVVQYVLRAIGRQMDKRPWPARAHLAADLASPAALAILAAGLGVGLFQLNLTDAVRAFANDILALLLVIAGFWYVYNLVGVIEVVALRLTRRTDSDLDDMVVPLFRRALRLFVVVLAVLFIAQNILGANIASWLAGLGIAGLAVSLAAQDSLKHLFGSVTIFFDRPFLVGSFVKYAGELGTIEQIGFRSTRMRTLDGHLMTIPNGNIVNDPVVNIGARPYIRRVLNVTVTYDTPAEKIEQAVQIIKDILATEGIRERVYAEQDPEDPANLPPRVYFSDYNAASLNIVVYYWHRPADWWLYLEHCEKFNLELFRRYAEAGIDFAFPTQTLYLASDANRPLAVSVDQRGAATDQ